MADALGHTPAAPTREPEPDDAFGRLTEAEQYALIHPRRAALIRSVGGLPDHCDFGPPAPDLVHAIVTGTSPTLRGLDMQGVA
jgi:hypothetical protein